MNKKTGYWFFFHFVFVYIILSFVWWWYLMQKNNKEDFETYISRQRITFLYEGGNEDQYYKSPIYLDAYSDYRKNNLMLMGEGVSFVVLSAIGFWRIRSSFKDEIAFTKQQNNFLLSITHELKSPLASLKLSMQTMHKRNLDQAKMQRLVQMSMDDIDRLENLVENILMASKIDSNNFALHKDILNLSEIAQNIFDKISDKFQGQRIFISTIEDNVYLYLDKLTLTSVIYNLLENAIKYSRQDAIIQILLNGDEKKVYLTITDTGIGISEKEKLKIFDRFYRIGNEDTRTTKGTGLGLYIVKNIVEMHQGSILVTQNTPHGSCFKIELPIS